MEVTTRMRKTDKLPRGKEMGNKGQRLHSGQETPRRNKELGKKQKNRWKGRRRTRLRYHPKAQKEMPEKEVQKKELRRKKVGKGATGERALP